MRAQGWPYGEAKAACYRRAKLDGLPDHQIQDAIEGAWREERTPHPSTVDRFPFDDFSIAKIESDAKTWEPVRHIETGLGGFDHHIGGLRTRAVHLVVGKSGRGKTTLVAQMLANVAASGVPTAFLSLELDRHDVARLLIAQASGVSRSFIERGDVRDGKQRQDFETAKGVVSAWPLHVLDDDFWTGGLTRSRMAAIVAEGRKRFGWELVAIDYIGLLAKEQGDTGGYDADLANATALKRMARANDVALVVVSAMRKVASFAKKSSKSDGAPVGLDDVIGAGRIVYDATNVFYIDSEQDEGGGTPTGTLYVHPLKTRYSGARADGEPLRFKWYPTIGRVVDDVMDYQGETVGDSPPPF